MSEQPPNNKATASDNRAVPTTLEGDEALAPEGLATRRGFLLSGLALLLAGCSSSPQRVASNPLPGPTWRSRSTSMPSPPPRDYAPPPSRIPSSSRSSLMIARSSWTSAGPVLPLMNRMLPIQCITVHHDGMGPFYDLDQRAAMGRLESIRRYHRETLGWGDIGYHYAIDRSGRVYECRSLSHQGAHVKNHNEGNIGVMLLGNFDQQSPSSAQVDTLIDHLSWLMRTHSVPVNRVHTHKEWQGARTACPGSTLQAHMINIRNRRMIG